MSDYAKALGARLRAIRQQQGLSLQGVEEKSGGRWKAVVVGSYERGDRAVTVARLNELAEFYRVPIAELLPGEGPGRHEGASKVVVDLERLEQRDAVMQHVFNQISPPPDNNGFLPQLLTLLPPVSVGFSLTIHF